ncbi:MAG: CRISPR-associated helicase Cas3', partial [Clostridia bacterium]
MEKEFLAKSNPKETIKEHTEKLIKCMDKFSKIYGDHFTKTELELIRIACQFHDIGKVNQVFQNKITGKIERNITEINHGCISGLYMDFRSMNEKYGEEYICALYTAIHYHHTREEKISPNEVDKYKDFLDNYTDTNMKKFLGQSAVYNTRWLKKLIFKYQCNDKSEVNIHQWEKYILIKGMLNKLDYAASAGISDIEEQKADNDNTLTKTINDKFKKTLLPAQQYMKDNCNENLIILAPTGTGKTEGALLWINNDKGFYTLPLKVASNSIYERIRDKYNYSKVALLHSDSIGYYIDEENGFQKYAKAKALSMPLTVCTVDQLFKFPFKALGTEIYPATLKYSKVIIDEIQMYSSTIIACLIIGLKIITDMGGKFAIITATLPPFIKTLINENIGETKYLYKQFTDVKFSKRHIIQIKGEELDLDKILESAEDKKVLVICNTVSKAQEIYKKLKSKNNEIDINLIHSRYIKKDRDELEKKILDFTTKDSVNKKGIWVSTQIVEASLDIDFDELHTEMCIADSLLQRVGRCYRA